MALPVINPDIHDIYYVILSLCQRECVAMKLKLCSTISRGIRKAFSASIHDHTIQSWQACMCLLEQYQK